MCTTGHAARWCQITACAASSTWSKAALQSAPPRAAILPPDFRVLLSLLFPRLVLNVLVHRFFGPTWSAAIFFAACTYGILEELQAKALRRGRHVPQDLPSVDSSAQELDRWCGSETHVLALHSGPESHGSERQARAMGAGLRTAVIPGGLWAALRVWRGGGAG